jgi:hypothetical protein
MRKDKLLEKTFKGKGLVVSLQGDKVWVNTTGGMCVARLNKSLGEVCPTTFGSTPEGKVQESFASWKMRILNYHGINIPNYFRPQWDIGVVTSPPKRAGVPATMRKRCGKVTLPPAMALPLTPPCNHRVRKDAVGRRSHLWFLKRREGAPTLQAKVIDAMVIRAGDEELARKLASLHDNTPTSYIWMSAGYALCDKLEVNGEPDVLLVDEEQ